jgi:Uma2 family endonuclease
MSAIALKLEPILPMTDENFLQLCHLNPEAKLELTAQLELVIMTPTGGSTGNRNIKLSARLERWTEKEGTGVPSTLVRCLNYLVVLFVPLTQPGSN